jgi:hypothetical protein
MRFWARILDNWVLVIPVGVIVAFVYPRIVLWNDFLVGMLLLFIFSLIEPVMMCMFGTTLGKFLFGIQVRTRSGGRLSFGQALKRSLRVWFYGWGMGIPVVSLITLAAAYQNLNQEEITTWDKRGDFRVLHRRIGVAKILATVTLVLGLLVLLGALKQMARN